MKNVAIEELDKPPYRARVDFYMVYYSPADHSELKRTLYTANFVFFFKSQRPERTHSDQSARPGHHLFPRRRSLPMNFNRGSDVTSQLRAFVCLGILEQSQV